jgi:hypothetical protein
VRATHRLIATLATLLVVTSTVPLTATSQTTADDPFPGPDEVNEQLDRFEEHPWVDVHHVGTSNDGNPLRVAETVDLNGTMPVDERPVTLLLTQQHGNEPAGTPAALRLMANITDGGQPADWLSNQVLLVMPMVNPDGAVDDARGNANGTDINRDHIALDTPEAKAVHRVIDEWEIDVASDHHEYGGTGPGNPVPVRTYDYDLLTLFPKHGNVRAPTLDLAQELMYDGIWPDAREAGYSVNEYGEVTADDEPVTEIAGGPDPGILRNHFGLHNIAGLLVESRIDQQPNPEHGAERRIQSHRVVMNATLEYVHEHPDRFTEAKNQSQTLAVELPPDEYVEGDDRAPMASAYQLPENQSLVDTMTRHGIDPGVETDDGYVHEIAHPIGSHAAAIFHPNSSRAVVEGTPTDPIAGDEANNDTIDASSTAPNGVPAVSSLLVTSLLALLALARRR